MATTSNVEVIQADYQNEEHARAIEQTLNQYAMDPCGGGEPIKPEKLAILVSELAKVPGAFSVLAFVEGKPAGLLNCFMGFSSFQVMPLVNIHDCVVIAEFRRMGICSKMLSKCEEIANERGCASITLEVLQHNITAQGAYRKFGFGPYELDPAMGAAQFWKKSLAHD
jgi:ribosomal protein S18 acetylase RimI-like enzyme